MTQQNWIARPALPHTAPLLARFLAKFTLDILPAALASVIGGFLFTQYQFGHTAPAHPPAEQVTPASAEMMTLVRDEHAMILDYLKAQMAAEKNRQVAEDAQARDAADTGIAKPAAASTTAEPPARHIAAAVFTPKAAVSRAKAPVVVAAATHAPLVIAQADQNVATGNDGIAPEERFARDPNSLLAKTLNLKDHVVAATRQVVFVIGDMFTSVGERIGGTTTNSRPFNWDS